jgi:hypothetical protein|tara:strand:+ start:3683 stop:4030 length:348 start_codon:yes stop_codon:yes gene_type:complete
VSWKEILKANPNIYEIRRISPSFAVEVERMVELRDNEELLGEFIDGVEENKDFGLEEAIQNSIDNLSRTSKKDKDIFFYNLRLQEKDKYDRFKKNPSDIIDDVLEHMLQGMGDDL